ncbi:MAG: tRNA 2-thiocytidine biosynthesis TtcA family protein [Firmicutes bacterium]|nr:tRNA 2-thiocytidine biosynthesis TtcA family protein [Bacillota bacterium]
MKKELTELQLIERSIHKKFRKTIWKPFVAGVQRYQLIQEGDSIAVCISGGKDSMIMAKLMQALHSFSDFPFDVKYVVMNPGYNEINLQKVVSNAAKLEIPIEIFDSNIFDVVTETDRSPCYLCARMRRGFLYSYAQKLGCNKIALGHHFNDVVETTLMGMLFGAQIQTMMPKVRSKNFEGMELIRPMYCVHEDMIIAWARYNNLQFIQCACPLAENCNVFDASGGVSKRQEVKALLKNLKHENKDVEKSIFQSIHSVNLDTIIGYKLDDVEYSFLDRY